jgi:2,4-didehydro-3-deoxy-L-rhamnonate hydrolase
MKLIRFGEEGRESPGIILGEIPHSLEGFEEDFNESFFQTGGLDRLRNFIRGRQLRPLPTGTRLGPPVARPSKIVCIGLNYADHARETGAQPPAEPVIFLKSTTSLCGPYDEIIIPRDSVKTDWEVELAVVMGRKASYVGEAVALDYVAGYCLHNDVSEREFQLERGGTWDKGKGCDHFAPLGPWLLTSDEMTDTRNLRLWLTVNGKRMQDGNTDNFIFNVAQVISYISRFMTLLPGDIISTGTPAGVGLGMKPPLYLKPGDLVELGIEGLGTSRQKCVAYGKN